MIHCPIYQYQEQRSNDSLNNQVDHYLTKLELYKLIIDSEWSRQLENGKGFITFRY
jgi:hypothetical protein